MFNGGRYITNEEREKIKENKRIEREINGYQCETMYRFKKRKARRGK